MSARGTRSRKVQQKDVWKKEEKASGKRKGPQVNLEQSLHAFDERRSSPAPDYPAKPLTKSFTISSNLSRATSHSDGSNDNSTRSRPRLNASHSSNLALRPSRRPTSSGSDSTGISVPGRLSGRKEKTTFEAHGKETKAPRGRGGGVPIKRAVAPSPILPIFLNDLAASYPSPSQKSWVDFKIWEGRKGVLRSYRGFNFDQDMQNGSVLIFFKEEQDDEDRPIPSLRADLETLELSGSTWLRRALHYGRIEDSQVDEWPISNASSSAKSIQHISPQASWPMPKTSVSSDTLDQSSTPHYDAGFQTAPPNRRPAVCDPTHEIWFTAPSTINTPQGQRLYHVAVRNFLALLHGKPLVGTDFFEMLKMLQHEIQSRYEIDVPNQPGSVSRDVSVQMITEYLQNNYLDDVRDNILQALSLLAWSEQEGVRWRQGYLESFVHLAGAMTPQIEELEEFKRLSVVTRRNLGLTSKTLQLRVMEAEEKLATFDFSDLWADTNVAKNSVYQSYQAFRQFLVDYYQRVHGSWPPVTGNTWLSRQIVLSLQEDFGSLYDYLVNRDVVWNPREERASRKWEMAHRCDEHFRADLPELGITDILVTFDTKHGYSHIPHPYPLLPRETPKLNKEKDKKGFFSKITKSKNKDTTQDAKQQLQLSIFFNDATNIEKLDMNFNGSTLIDKFEQFELTTDLRHVTPREARLGRWVLLYGILQVLSTLAVDVQGIRYKDDVHYFLCTDLKRCPEWVTLKQTALLEANQHYSWCWQRAWDPEPRKTALYELDASPSANKSDMSRQNFQEPIECRNQSLNKYSTRDRPNPPPQHPLPASPSRSNVLLANDFPPIDEESDDVSLKYSASQAFQQEFERRRENEKVLQKSLEDDKLSSAQPPTMNMTRTQRLWEDFVYPLSDKKPRTRDNSFSLFPSDQRTPSRDGSVLLLPLSRGTSRSKKNDESGAHDNQLQDALPPPLSSALSSTALVSANLSNLNNLVTDPNGLPPTPMSINFPSPPSHGANTLEVGHGDGKSVRNRPIFERRLEEHQALAGLPVQDDWV